MKERQFGDVGVEAKSCGIADEIASPADFWAAECKKSVWPQSASGADELRVVDLFSGCGGLSLGALLAATQLGLRLKVALAADIWRDAFDVYRHNFSRFLETGLTLDLSDFVSDAGSLFLSEMGRDIASSVGRVDVMVAGPPCQGNSNLNNSSRRDDPRNLLYTIPVAFGIYVRAKIIVIENVPSVVHGRDHVVQSAFEVLTSQGYTVTEVLMNAQDIGLPQTRKRHVLVASRVHNSVQLADALDVVARRKFDVPLWPFIDDLEFEADVLDDLMTRRTKVSAENMRRMAYLFDAEAFDLPNGLRPACHRDREHSYISMYGRLRRERPAQTITSGFGSMGQGRFVHPTQRRMITAHEAARIQGFPDYFKFAPVAKLTALREMIGNAVAPPMAGVLLKLLLESAES